MTMKNSAIKSLLNIGLHSDYIQSDDGYKKLIDEKNDYENQLMKKFTPELSELFKAYQSVIDKILISDTDDFFAYGFKHGVLLGLEIAAPDQQC